MNFVIGLLIGVLVGFVMGLGAYDDENNDFDDCWEEF